MCEIASALVPQCESVRVHVRKESSDRGSIIHTHTHTATFPAFKLVAHMERLGEVLGNGACLCCVKQLPLDHYSLFFLVVTHHVWLDNPLNILNV